MILICIFAFIVLVLSAADTPVPDEYSFQALSGMGKAKQMSDQEKFYKVERLHREMTLNGDRLVEQINANVTIRETYGPKLFMYGILGLHIENVSYFNCTGYLSVNVNEDPTFVPNPESVQVLPSIIIDMKDTMLDLDAKFLQVNFKSLCAGEGKCGKYSAFTLDIRIEYIKAAANLKSVADLIYMDRFELVPSKKTIDSQKDRELTQQEVINKNLVGHLPEHAKEAQTIKSILYGGESGKIYTDSVAKNMKEETEQLYSDNDLLRLRICDYPILPYETRYSSTHLKMLPGSYKTHTFVGHPGDGTKIRISDDGSEIFFGVYNYPFTMRCNRMDLDFKAFGSVGITDQMDNKRLSVESFRMVSIGSGEYYGVGTGFSNLPNIHIRDYIKVHNNSPEPREPFDRIANLHSGKIGKILSTIDVQLIGDATSVRVHDRLGKVHSTQLIFQEGSKWARVRPRYNLAGGMNGEFVVEYDTTINPNNIDFGSKQESFKSAYGSYNYVTPKESSKTFIRYIFDFLQKYIMKIAGKPEKEIEKTIEFDNKYALFLTSAPVIHPAPVFDSVEYCIHLPEAAYDIDINVPFPSTNDSSKYEIRNGNEKNIVLRKSGFETLNTNIVCTKRNAPTSDLWALDTIKATYAINKNVLLHKVELVFSFWLAVFLAYTLVRFIKNNKN